MKHSELLAKINDCEIAYKLQEKNFNQQKIEYLNHLMLDNEYWVNIEQNDYEKFFTDYAPMIFLLVFLIVFNLLILVGIGSIFGFPHFLTNTTMILLFGNIVTFILTSIKENRQTKIIYHQNNKYLFVSKYAIKKEITKVKTDTYKIDKGMVIKIKYIIKNIYYKLKKRDRLELLGDFMAVLCFMAFFFTIWFIDGKINLRF